MGGTLPVLTRFVRGGDGVGRRLSSLYAFNTLGAVAGTLAAGFLFIPSLGVTWTMLLACGVSTAVGVLSLWLQSRAGTTMQVAGDVGGNRGPNRGPGFRVRTGAAVGAGRSA